MYERGGARGEYDMYRMAVLKQGLERLHTPIADTIKGWEFTTEMIPLEAEISAEYFVLHPVDLLLIDLCKNPQLGLSLLKQLRILGVQGEVVAYIARDDCDTLRRVLRLGVVDCLVDPFDTNRFEQAVERFQRRKRLFVQEAVTQEQVDGLYSGLEELPELPKGLQKKTLNTIRAVLLSRPDTSFSCEDIVGTVNLSRITVRRYLAYLRQAGEVTEDVNYRTGGRPCSLYRCNPGVFA